MANVLMICNNTELAKELRNRCLPLVGVPVGPIFMECWNAAKQDLQMPLKASSPPRSSVSSESY